MIVILYSQHPGVGSTTDGIQPLLGEQATATNTATTATTDTTTTPATTNDNSYGSYNIYIYTYTATTATTDTATTATTNGNNDGYGNSGSYNDRYSGLYGILTHHTA